MEGGGYLIGLLGELDEEGIFFFFFNDVGVLVEDALGVELHDLLEVLLLVGDDVGSWGPRGEGGVTVG